MPLRRPQTPPEVRFRRAADRLRDRLAAVSELLVEELSAHLADQAAREVERLATLLEADAPTADAAAHVRAEHTERLAMLVNREKNRLFDARAHEKALAVHRAAVRGAATTAASHCLEEYTATLRREAAVQVQRLSRFCEEQKDRLASRHAVCDAELRSSTRPALVLAGSCEQLLEDTEGAVRALHAELMAAECLVTGAACHHRRVLQRAVGCCRRVAAPAEGDAASASTLVRQLRRARLVGAAASRAEDPAEAAPSVAPSAPPDPPAPRPGASLPAPPPARTRKP